MVLRFDGDELEFLASRNTVSEGSDDFGRGGMGCHPSYGEYFYSLEVAAEVKSSQTL